MKALIRSTRSIDYLLTLILLAILVAACGSSGSSAMSSPAASGTGNFAVYQLDSGGITGADDVAQQAGYTSRYTGDEVYDRLNGGYSIVEHGLPKAADLNQVETGEAGAIGSETAVLWQPNGRRDTLLPPSAHGERIYAVVVVLDGYITGGDATARATFVSRVQGGALNPKDPSATPVGLPPNQIYTYTIDNGTAAALLDYFFVKGAAPTETVSV
jgi:hypothetical protein